MLTLAHFFQLPSNFVSVRCSACTDLEITREFPVPCAAAPAIVHEIHHSNPTLLPHPRIAQCARFPGLRDLHLVSQNISPENNPTCTHALKEARQAVARRWHRAQQVAEEVRCPAEMGTAVLGVGITKEGITKIGEERHVRWMFDLRYTRGWDAGWSSKGCEEGRRDASGL